MPNNKIKVTHWRRVDNGHYCTEKFAKQHPNMTVKETDWLTRRNPKKK